MLDGVVLVVRLHVAATAAALRMGCCFVGSWHKAWKACMLQDCSSCRDAAAIGAAAPAFMKRSECHSITVDCRMIAAAGTALPNEGWCKQGNGSEVTLRGKIRSCVRK